MDWNRALRCRHCADSLAFICSVCQRKGLLSFWIPVWWEMKACPWFGLGAITEFISHVYCNNTVIICSSRCHESCSTWLQVQSVWPAGGERSLRHCTCLWESSYLQVSAIAVYDRREFTVHLTFFFFLINTDFFSHPVVIFCMPFFNSWGWRTAVT